MPHLFLTPGMTAELDAMHELDTSEPVPDMAHVMAEEAAARRYGPKLTAIRADATDIELALDRDTPNVEAALRRVRAILATLNT